MNRVELVLLFRRKEQGIIWGHRNRGGPTDGESQVQFQRAWHRQLDWGVARNDGVRDNSDSGFVAQKGATKEPVQGTPKVVGGLRRGNNRSAPGPAWDGVGGALVTISSYHPRGPPKESNFSLDL